MMKLKYIITILFLTVSLTIFASGNAEKNQFSSDFKIISGEDVIDSFKITRESKLGTELIKVVSNTKLKTFYMEKFDIPIGYVETAIEENQYNGNKTNTEIKSLKPFNYTSDKDLNNLSDIISVEYSHENVKVGITLINKEIPSKSYQIILEILPNIAINPNEFSSIENIIHINETMPEYKKFFKNQLMGSNIFNPTEENPFPLSEINNDYVFKMKADSNLTLRKENSKNNIGYFDTIYNYNVNQSIEVGKSIIQKLLNVYYFKNKPLFHYYINEYMEEEGNYFDYTEYSMLTKDEGEDFVNSALKYLTWGIEYTPNNNKRALTVGDSIYPSQIFKNNNVLKAWLQNNSDNKERTENYLPFPPKSIKDVVNESDPTYDLEKIHYLESIASEYFEATDTKLENINLTTPFISGDIKVTGSSLPYVEGGMDSPRTFNYKMFEQRKVIDRYLSENKHYWYGDSTGEDRELNDHLFSITKNGELKIASDYYFFLGDSTSNLLFDNPFTPGKSTGNTYKGINLTGVDSLGLLSGSLAMTGFYNKVLGLDNDKKAEELDGYYKMSKDDQGKVSSEFLNEDGLPKFTEIGDHVLDSIRFTREDIERSTVIVPNLSLIQPGDLLVNTKEGKTEIAIIVDSGYTSGADTFNMANVLVLSVTEEDGRVALNYWGNSGVLSSFTTRPKDFIVRRLIKFNGDINAPNEFTGIDLWDPFVYTPETIITDLNLDLDNERSVNNSHWIPNTGELYEIRSISFKTSDNELVEGNNIPVKIIPPTDMYYSNTDPENNDSAKGSNILVNKGDGFEFYAIQFIDKGNDKNKIHDYVKLATFKKISTSQSSNTRYEVIYEPGIFTVDGETKGDYSLLSVYGYLEFKKNDENRYDRFGIRPLENNIRPGDDILLNFQLDMNNNRIEALSEEEDFLAVYDKKMLWRANLYIDDDDTGSLDFNNRYPWNAPTTEAEANTVGDYEEVQLDSNDELIDNSTKIIRRFYTINEGNDPNNITSLKVWYGPNEWNKVMITNEQAQEYSTNNSARGYNWEDLSGLIQGNGKQVISIPSSVYYNINTSSRVNTKSVVYELYRTSTPFEFYNQMYDQYSTILVKATELKNIMDIAKTLLDTEDTELNRAAFQKAKTAFDNYKFPDKNTLLPSLSTSLGNLHIDDGNKPKLLEVWKKYDIELPKPASRDAIGWTVSPQKPFSQPVGEKTIYGKIYSKQESGVDCGGLIYMSEAYKGTKYKSYGEGEVSAEKGMRSIHDTGEGTNYTPTDNLYSIMNRNEYDDDLNIKPENRKRVVPGDIIYYPGYHVMIVQDVEIENGNREIELENIKVIESTHSGYLNLFGVGNQNNLFFYHSPENEQDREWSLGRIKQSD